MKRDILVIPDAHANPRYDNERFTAIGKVAKKLKPQIIVCLGDLADMESLSRFDRNTLSSEGRRYRQDIESANDALARLDTALGAMRVKKFVVRGNHEAFIERAANEDPKMAETLRGEDLQFKEFGWESVPFKEILKVQGWHFSHFFPSGTMGREIGGKNAAASILREMHASCVSGHAHTLDLARQWTATGGNITSIVAGCMVHKDYVMDWCRNTRKMWWRGLTYIRGAENGQWDGLDFIEASRFGA